MVATTDLLDRALAARAALGLFLYVFLARFLFFLVGFLSLPIYI